MKLYDIWKLGDDSPFKMFIVSGVASGTEHTEVLDGPGFPVVDGKDASNLEVSAIKPAHYQMYGNVLEVTLAAKKRRFPGYGMLEYLKPGAYFNSDNWVYESTEEAIDGTEWDIVSRRNAFPNMDCRYTTIIRK